MVEAFEQYFGAARAQAMPCDASIQQPDQPELLNDRDAAGYRSIVGLCLYIGRDRPDVVFTVKELSACMSKPTLGALQKLRKLVGYFKQSGDTGMMLWDVSTRRREDQEGIGDFVSLRAFRMLIGVRTRLTGATSCGIHFVNGSFVYGSSRSQRVISLSSCESELAGWITVRRDLHQSLLRVHRGS